MSNIGKYVGQYKNGKKEGKKEGKSELTHLDGRKYVGKVKNGKIVLTNVKKRKKETRFIAVIQEQVVRPVQLHLLFQIHLLIQQELF